MICERCHHEQPFRFFATSNGNWVQRCERCGTPHSCAKGRAAEVISPPLAGIADPRTMRLSPWMDGRYGPYVPGVYECEFRDGLRLRLAWDGSAWTWTGLVVDTTDLVKWRGKWL